MASLRRRVLAGVKIVFGRRFTRVHTDLSTVCVLVNKMVKRRCGIRAQWAPAQGRARSVEYRAASLPHLQVYDVVDHYSFYKNL